MAGLVIHEARSIPEPRQTFSFHGFRFEVLRKQRNRIAALRITPLAAPHGGAPARSARTERRRLATEAPLRRRQATPDVVAGFTRRLYKRPDIGQRPTRGLDVLEQSRRRPMALAGTGALGPGAARPAAARRSRGYNPPRSGGPWQADPGRDRRRRQRVRRREQLYSCCSPLSSSGSPGERSIRFSRARSASISCSAATPARRPPA